MRKLSLCITTWERVEMTLNCFKDVLDDIWVDEIVIVDDCSDMYYFNGLKDAVRDMPKVKLYRNEINLDCYANKAQAISKAANDWCILFDSDNTMTKQYITKIYEQAWNKDTILAPVRANPTFDYSTFEGMWVLKENVATYMDEKMFATALNTHNMFVNRDEYLKCFDPSINPHSSDSIYMNKKWLEAGNRIYFVPGLEYDHKIHPQSHYQANCHKSPDFYQKVEQELRNMK